MYIRSLGIAIEVVMTILLAMLNGIHHVEFRIRRPAV